MWSRAPGSFMARLMCVLAVKGLVTACAAICERRGAARRDADGPELFGRPSVLEREARRPATLTTRSA